MVDDTCKGKALSMIDGRVWALIAGALVMRIVYGLVLRCFGFDSGHHHKKPLYIEIILTLVGLSVFIGSAWIFYFLWTGLQLF